MKIKLIAFLFTLCAAGCGPDLSHYSPPEVGWHTDAVNKKQGDKAKADELVVYRYEWASNDHLSEYGERHLGEIETAVLRQTVPNGTPVVIEPSGNAAVDSVRQTVIAGRLRRDLSGALLAVVVAKPTAPGIEGIEAVNVDADTPSGGQTNGANTGNASGFGSRGASGFGGSGFSGGVSGF